MQRGAIEGFNLMLRGNGSDVSDLHAIARIEDGYNAVTTAWIPTPEEVLRIMAGQPVYVTLLCGDSFPPMRVEVKK